MPAESTTNGDNKITAYLNGALANEVAAANQYFTHARLYKHFGLYRLCARAYQESIGEMKHADRLIERILCMDGTPNPHDLKKLQDLKKLLVGEEMLMRDRQLELNCITLLKEAIEYCDQKDDRISRELLQDILRDEQEHADWLLAELDRMGRVEPHDYL